MEVCKLQPLSAVRYPLNAFQTRANHMIQFKIIQLVLLHILGVRGVCNRLAMDMMESQRALPIVEGNMQIDFNVSIILVDRALC